MKATERRRPVPNTTSNHAGNEAGPSGPWMRMRGGDKESGVRQFPDRFPARNNESCEGTGSLARAAVRPTTSRQQLGVRGQNSAPHWSPMERPGSGFSHPCANRGRLLGVYAAAAKVVQFLAQSVDSEAIPNGSIDGKSIAFVRGPAETPETSPGFLHCARPQPRPWAHSGCRCLHGAQKKSAPHNATPQGSFPQ